MKQPTHLTLLQPDGTRFCIDRTAPPIELQSAYQHIAIETTAAFGRLYTLDGDGMAAEADEFIIHESLVHLVALPHPAPARALILGGGDGASARELLKHPSIRQIIVAELDPDVIAIVRTHLPFLPAGAFDDSRVRIDTGDAAATLRTCHAAGDRFDLILFDLTASDHPSCAHLHSPELLQLCAASLAPGGTVHVQLGSPTQQAASVHVLDRCLRALFPTVRHALIDVPLYGGPWLLARAALHTTPEPDASALAARLAERRITGLRYYNPALHHACGILPNYIQDCLT